MDKTGLPKFIVTGVLSIIRQTIQSKAKFNINDLDVVKRAERCSVPGLFLASKSDSFTRAHHSEKLKNAYKSENKQIVYFDGEHNESRPEHLTRRILEFISAHFGDGVGTALASAPARGAAVRASLEQQYGTAQSATTTPNGAQQYQYSFFARDRQSETQRGATPASHQGQLHASGRDRRTPGTQSHSSNNFVSLSAQQRGAAEQAIGAPNRPPLNEASAETYELGQLTNRQRTKNYTVGTGTTTA